MHPIAMLSLTVPVLVAQPTAKPTPKVEYDAIRKAISKAGGQIAKASSAKSAKDSAETYTLKALADIKARQMNAKGETREAYLVAELTVRLYGAGASDCAARIIKEVPPSSPAWQLAPPDLPDFLARHLGDTGAQYAIELERQGTPEFRIAVQKARIRLCVGKGDYAKARTLLSGFEANFPQSADVSALTKELKDAESIAAVTAIGAPAPDFSLMDIENEGNTFTLASFKGRYVMLDFWATWCTVCVMEIPGVQAAYAKYKDKGFEILSVTADSKADLVRQFRKKPGTPMPWKHAFGGGKPHDNPIDKAYHVDGYPSYFLIGPDGKIVAKGADLRGKKLAQTLEKFLEPKS